MRRERTLEVPRPLGGPARSLRAALRRALAALWPVLSDAAIRAVDLAVASVCLLLTSPLLALVAVRSRLRCGRILRRRRRVGRFRQEFDRLELADGGLFSELPTLWNVLRGDLALVGPRPLTREEAAAVPVRDLVRFSARPGLTSRFVLRSGIGMHSEPEFESDRRFYYEETLKSDLGVLARTVANRTLSGSARPLEHVERFQIFGVEVSNLTMDDAVDWIVGAATEGRTSKVAFVNPDCLNKAYRDDAYRRALASCDLVLPDGIGVHIACRMLGTPLAANVNGTDLFPVLCEEAAQQGLPLYLLGAREGIAAAAGEEMVRRFPDLRLAGARDGYFSSEEEEAVLGDVRDSGARVVLVALGAPRQEIWIERCAEALPDGVALGVGGLFDYYSGRIERAPRWVREIGLEWAWRVLQEPGRLWRRYLVGNPLFLWRVWLQAQGRGPGGRR